MKIVLFTTLIVILSFKTNYARARHLKQDTIYYLIDTAKVPVSDRIVSVNKEKNNAFLTIYCPCLQNGNKPVFRFNTSKKTTLSSSGFKKITLYKLSELIDLVKKNDGPSFNEDHAIFFIMPAQKAYSIFRAYFLGGNVNSVN